MTTREKILAAVANNQPPKSELPDLSAFKTGEVGSVEQFVQVLTNIGGKAIHVNSWEEIAAFITENYSTTRVVTPIAELTGFKGIPENSDPHGLYDVELAVIKAHFGVAENGAVWITEDNMGLRVLPFITQHLAVVIDGGEIVPTMAEAYDKISLLPSYGFASFIAGPSKTADIEQSLVIGAHGPRSMTVFIKT
ncbi:LUD domain-containing protein [Mucilaginibacter sp.]|uniref:LutC/YkgG family protein n=1 Tax=Mucilaginibacter sp. TaxID=1882438 RepID=UPI002619E654|nr:LUD domain-containing protein [Mucilaginibacter sp.]MDB4927314.1 lactate utilization protein [Mucilaginibacter sp.]